MAEYKECAGGGVIGVEGVFCYGPGPSFFVEIRFLKGE